MPSETAKKLPTPQNPYTLTFGKEPSQLISQVSQIGEIVTTFQEENPSQQVFLITGMRGSGKTVLMTEASSHFAADQRWITVELNPERDMLQSLAAKLASEDKLAHLFKAAKINLSLFGFGVEMGETTPIADIEIALREMLVSLREKGKRVLVTIDEASNTQGMRVFASSFQILIRQNLPLYVLMTGLHENIRALQDEKSLTFLYRAPKLPTTPLNMGAMAENYQKNLGVDGRTGLEMAKLTRGYPFAFQTLGYLTWRHGSFDENVISQLKHYLEDFVYEKVWSEMSANDKRVATGIARANTGRISEVRDFLNMDTNHFNPYRKRLVDKGIVDGRTHGFVSFTLPFFDTFVLENAAADAD